MIRKVMRTLSLFTLIFSLGCGGSSSSAPSNDNASDNQSSPDSPAGEDGMGEAGMDEGGMAPEMAGAEMGMDDPGIAGEAVTDSGSSSSGEPGDPEMMSAEMNEPGAEGDIGGVDGFGGQPRKPPRPAKTTEWTPEQTIEAIAEGDAKVIEIINTFAEQKIGQASAVGQFTTWVAALTKAPQAGGATHGGEGGSGGEAFIETAGEMEGAGMDGFGGEGFGGQRGPSGKEKIARALLDGLALNGSKGANAAVEQVFQGKIDLGVPQDKSMEWAMVALMKNLSPANQSSQALLWKALTVPSASPPEVATDPKAPPKKKEKSLQERAKDLHLGFAVAAMNSLIGAEAPPANARQNNFGMMGSGEMEGFEASGGEMMEMPGGPGANGAPQGNNQPPAKPLQIPHVSLNQAEAEAAVSYLWGEQMVGLATSMLQKNPNSAEALVFAAAIPFPETRDAVESVFKENQTKSPRQWLQQQLFEKQLTDPAIHVFAKLAPREQRAGGSNRGAGGSGETGGAEGLTGAEGSAGPARPRPGRPAKKKEEPDPEAIARKEASYDWMEASEKSLLSLMDRMYEGALKPDAQTYVASDLPFSIHKGAEVTTSLRFTLPGESGALQSAESTIVNYVRIESSRMNQRTVQHYRSALRDEDVLTILGGNGMWMDGKVKPNKKSGTIRSLDILLSKSNARPTKSKPNQNGQAGNGSGSSDPGSAETGLAEENFDGGGGGAGGGAKFVVEILVVEIPDGEEPEEGEAPKVSALTNSAIE
ncbi:hypothetical protein [Thalassoglobus polymorphus]|uniref:Uncharacterized protein n=1 Tax=Thalassoglobus polymorphus TaxID=2527994 RepID=A0A517QIJ5_9PLAN|nr:hypothetical protein [Thalassoglobus polymorphus]QDT31460.1 hypothetical protein Mal48_06930 [Thalassoglobus polymorphus]